MVSKINTRVRLNELVTQPEGLSPGHRLCAGCAAPVIVRQVLAAIEGPVVVANATGCLEVATSIYPYTSWRVPWIHSAFENAAATMSGVEAMYRSLVRQGRLEDRGLTFVVFGGDGGTYDIGLQSLSGALERGHRFLYVCYDNQAYMNTGIQRSSATPRGAATTTSPAGSVLPGKGQYSKDLTAIVAAHHIPYAAQASLYRWKDLMLKVRKAVAAEGPAFLNVYAPCNRGWRIATDSLVEDSRLAVETCFWPLFEVEEGRWNVTYKPRQKLPLAEWLQSEGRFKHLFADDDEALIEEMQAEVDRRWQTLLARAEVESVAA